MLKRGCSFSVEHNNLCSSFNYDLSSFCRKLRFHRFFKQNGSVTTPSPYIQTSSTASNPPTNLDAQFESDIFQLESLIMLDSEIIKNNSPDYKNLVFLSKNSDLKFCKADKGGCLVILNRNDYEKLVYQHLCDTETYQITPIDLNNIMDVINQLVSTHRECLHEDERKFLTKFESRYSKFYILPKIHKSQVIKTLCENNSSEYVDIGSCPSDLVSRPIVSNIESPTSHLSHLIDRLLNPFVDTINGYIRDTFDFLQKMPWTVSRNSKFVNLDVTSLYTVIPKDYGLNAIQYWLNKYPTKLDSRFSPQFILDSLNIILTYNIFKFKHCTYQQISGTAMGTKVAPKYAHLVMAFLELCVKSTCLKHFGSVITEKIFYHYWRFLDDIIIISDLNDEEINQLIAIFNNEHCSFVFTYKISTENTHFLDVQINLNGNQISTDIYHKPTDSLQYLHFYSHHPRHIKRNIPYCLAFRINRIVSSNDIKIERLNELKGNLLELKYPINLINDAISKCFQDYNPKPKQNVSTSLFFSMPYNHQNVDFYQENILPKLKRLNENSYQETPIKITRCMKQPPNILRMLNMKQYFSVNKCNRPRCKTCKIIIINSKDILINCKLIYFNQDMNCQSKNVIYVIFCKTCDQFYIGETNMALNIRMNLHRQHINKPEYSILFVSSHLRHCKSNYSVVPIFQSKNSSSYLLVQMEKYFISYLKPSLNRSA